MALDRNASGLEWKLKFSDIPDHTLAFPAGSMGFGLLRDIINALRSIVDVDLRRMRTMIFAFSREMISALSRKYSTIIGKGLRSWMQVMVDESGLLLLCV